MTLIRWAIIFPFIVVVRCVGIILLFNRLYIVGSLMFKSSN